MLSFIIQKLLNKKWLVSCSLIGAILLVAIMACNPMYTEAALKKMLIDELEEHLVTKNEYPVVASMSATLNNSSLNKYSSDIVKDYKTGAKNLANQYSHKTIANVTYLTTVKKKATLEVGREDFSKIDVSASTLLDMDKHINIVYGSTYTDNTDDDNVIECIISERMLINSNIIVGDVFETTIFVNDVGDLKFKVVGVFQANKANDPYWVNDPLTYDKDFFISNNDFDRLFMSSDKSNSITCEHYAVFDYRTIKTDEINAFITSDNNVRDDCYNNGLYSCKFNFEDSFKNYRDGSSKVTTTMWIFEFPVMILLCVFIFMVSNQIISIEQGEIAMLKSRGVSKKKLILSYFIQSCIISGIAFVIGIPIGYFFCKFFGQTKSFLEFSVFSTIDVELTGMAFVYALIAALFAAVIMTLPVRKYANFSIVEQKTNKKKNKKPLWQTVFVDVILLVVSLYGFYTFNKQKSLIIESMSSSDASLDPLLYFSSTIFILSSSLLLLRIIPLIVRFVFYIGKKKWKPAVYASFMQIQKTIKKQSFIIVFLVLTLALGIFNATTARTITDNEEKRVRYTTGSDIVLMDQWGSNKQAIALGYATELEFYEPSYEPYTKLEKKVDSFTKVVRDDKASLSYPNGVLENCTFMAINTYEFGKTCYLPEDANKFHINWYLNALAKNPNGAIISRNYAEAAGLKVGDAFYLYRNMYKGSQLFFVSAIVDCWPSYSSTFTTVKNNEKQTENQYLCVVNYDTAFKAYGLEPYSIWVHAKDTQVVYDFAKENDLLFDSFEDSIEATDNIKEQPFFQITSGMLTLAFIVVLILSLIGFLIYWITSIKSRELMFGIYRAMGLSLGEIIKMLITEHIFGSLIPIIYGVGIGVIASKLFVPLIELAYSSTYSTLPTWVITSGGDMLRLGICILAMLVICFVIIGKILSKMKIAQALKLGED